MKTLWAIGCVLAFLALVNAAHAGSRLIGDGDFVGWDFTTVVGQDVPVPGVDDAEMTTFLDGGNTVLQNTTWSHTFRKPAWGVGISTTFTWDPSVDGPVTALSFEIDFRSGVNPGGEGQAVALAILQNGHYYTLAGGNTGVSVPLQSWNHLAYGPLTAANLHNSWAGPAFDDPPQAPDFSASGAPMQFGLAAGNHISGVKSNFYDNWTLLITSNPAQSVPLPSAALTAGLFLAGLIVVRKVRGRRSA